MKLHTRSLFLALAILLPSLSLAAPSQGSKTIHLRNERIVTPSKSAQSGSTAGSQEQSGRLYLIQFEGPIQPEWRESVSSLGVDLLNYVPDDTYIANIGSTPPGQLRRLDFVRWVGRHKLEHKIHGRLKHWATTNITDEAVDIRILVAPRTGSADLANVRGLLSTAGGPTRLRHGTVLRGRLPASRLEQLANSDAVLWIESAPRMGLFDEESSKIIGGDDGNRGTPTSTQQLGFDGSGVVVAVADSGLDSGDANSMHPDLAGRVDDIQWYGSLTDGSDEHSHGTHVAGIVAGNATLGETDEAGARYGLGVAPGAHIISQRIFDGAGAFTYTNSSFEQLTRDAVNAGADVGNNSWGEDVQGRYDLTAWEFDALVRDADSVTPGDQPYILEFSAGNAGPGAQTIGTPAVGKNVIATGATENNRFNLPFPEFTIYDNGQETMADFSSRGPCDDGRIKPDVVAPGTWIASLRSVYANDDFAWWPISDNYMYQGGTSQAGPGVAGAAAVFVQYYRFNHGGATPSPALVKAALIDSASDMDDNFGDTGPVPNTDEGWGRVDLTQIIGGAATHEFVDQTHLLTNSQWYEKRVIVAGSTSPLKITLTYTDVPGNPAAIKALVNDLDLEVIAPDGNLYRGNQFADGETVPNAPSADRINNVEGVRFAAPQPGEYLVRVRAYSIVADALAQTPEFDQDFALAVSGVLLPAGASLIATDRGSYTAPSAIRLTVVDPDLAGNPSVGVTIESATESAGESIVLSASGVTGVFTGAVATVTGTASTDGQLQISHGDNILAEYSDSSAGIVRTADAVADLVAPVLTGIASVSEFGLTTITWSSDEPATSIVRYGTNAMLSASLTNEALSTAHSLVPLNVESGLTYSFHVSGADEAGNASTNDNGGGLYSFVAVPASTALLVDSYVGPIFGAPPLSGYTVPLDQIGVPYDIWDATTLGSPPLSTLDNYQSVIWRVDELAASWTPADLISISNYLDSGGTMFVASMELFSRVSEIGGADFIRDVLQVESYLTDETGSTFAGQVTGAANDPLGNGIDLSTDFIVYDNLWLGLVGPDISDTMVPTANASAVFRNDFSDVIGIRWPAVGQEASGRLVLLSFPLDAVPLGSGVNDRVQLLRNAISFLLPGLNGLGTIALDSAAYSIPDSAFIEVADADLAGAGTVDITAFSDTYTNGVTVTLDETAKPGIFNGLMQVATNTAAPAAGVLPTSHNDALWVDYFDSSNSNTVRVTASVDAVSPVISGVTNELGYDATIISWTTTENSDSLVQYGESPLLERSAYDASQTTSHDVLLTGLIPSQTYYFKVVSRDIAGNTATDDNGGALHTFTTLTPQPTPWVDDLESGVPEWSVLAGDGTQAVWEHGSPTNALNTNGYSPVNAWGTNLDDDNDDAVQTQLNSPAIDLTGATSAELRLWQNYDLTDPDVIYTAELYIYTNATAQPTLLQAYGGASAGWEEAVVDLTPYAGKVVNLAWAYFLFSFDTDPHAGWLLDDISVTSDSSATIQLTNNIAQAGFSLSGPMNQTGAGRLVTYPSAPPGAYTVNYGAVPWYSAPPAQSNTLAVAGSLTFVGTYSFADANSNGMSDDWESAYFGSVSTNRTCATDTDGDGFTDCAEFAAGTNPTNATSYLLLDIPVTLPNGNLRVDWLSVPERIYRVESSTNLVQWTAISGWLRAATNELGHTFAPPTEATMYRVEVQP